MATAEQVNALVRSHAEGDETRFYSVAIQVAAEAARKGQHHVAKELKGTIERARVDDEPRMRVARPTPVSQPRGELAALMTASYPKAQISDMSLGVQTRDQLQRVITELRQVDSLESKGFLPLRRILLVGPPGTGKTMSARALAGELRLPLFTIRLDGIITKFMGESAAKLGLVFTAMAHTRGVYLFDEVDALAGERGNSNDVGEIRRVLNSFLQFLENDDSQSLLVAATNHSQLLDRAIFRRFDAVIEYSLPTEDLAEQVIRNRLALVPLEDVDWTAVSAAAAGLSHGEITLAAEKAAKDTIIAEMSGITTDLLVAALRERSSVTSRGHG